LSLRICKGRDSHSKAEGKEAAGKEEEEEEEEEEGGLLV
jgi:hypothetical protein